MQQHVIGDTGVKQHDNLHALQALAIQQLLVDLAAAALRKSAANIWRFIRVSLRK